MIMLAALRSRPAAWQYAPFRRLTAAWVATNLGDSALFLMAAVWVKDLTGSDGAAALVFAVLGLSTLTGPLVGALADRVHRRPLMIAANVLGAVLVATLFLVTSADLIWLIYVVVFFYGVLGVLTGAAQSGLLRDMLPDEHLASGNGLLSTIDQLLRLVSPLIGTALYVAAGPWAVVALTVVSFAATAVLLAFVRLTESEPETVSGDGFWSQMSAGFRHIWSRPALRDMTLLILVAFSATGLLNVAIFPVLEQGLGVPTAALGVLVTLQGVGAAIGGATSAALIKRLGEGLTFAIGLLLLAVGVGLILVPNLVVVAVAMAVGGLGIPWIVVAFTTTRQKETPARMQGRTAAATMMAINVPQAIITLIGAAIITIVDYRLLLGVTAVALLLSAVVGLMSRQREVTAS